ncbi:GNAT family N-acetyltransferase [Kitasatospora sp. RB6PN24]|uniref:GNAT family N-acetyltransferase n=1 Tax=Kitasatospora humi TaxID=2893891 RepID=UPI001E401FDB|nr:GNAT family N-acetyltransferase [Kitasatospora humi]MCC9307281.1 GNAT family N-acetyltransferase [Kitasatospora humi]
MTAPDTLLDLYDRQFRRSSDAHGRLLEHDGGPLVRGGGAGNILTGRRPGLGVTGAELDELIRRQVADGTAVHWRVHGHDRPAELGERLLAAGFTAKRRGTVLVGETAALTGEVPLPAGVTIRRTTDPSDADRIAEQHTEVWGEDLSRLARVLKDRMANRPDSTPILLAEAADGTLVCSAWTVLREDSDFAGLVGGSTLRAWRGRGIYRALVAHRARIAERHGYRYLHVEASDDSAPILRRLGFQAITTVTLYDWTPPA